MAKSPHTTPEPEGGKTVFDRVSDIDGPLGEVEAQVNVLQQLTVDYADAGKSENEVAVQWMVYEIARSQRKIYELWEQAFEAAKGGKPAKPATTAPAASPKTQLTIRDHCHQWDITKAKLDLDILERGHEQETVDHLVDPAHERFQQIAMAILTTEPDDINDDDIVAMLRLARKVIGNDEYRTEQQEWCNEMLERIDTTLCRRSV